MPVSDPGVKGNGLEGTLKKRNKRTKMCFLSELDLNQLCGGGTWTRTLDRVSREHTTACWLVVPSQQAAQDEYWELIMNAGAFGFSGRP